MSQPYVGEIRMFGGNFAPSGWMLCQGQLLPISQYETLFNLIGTTYGGDGQSTFQLPNLQGRVPMHQGTGFVIGQVGGEETVTLTTQQIPSHNHAAQADGNTSTQSSPAGAIWGNTTLNSYTASTPSAAMAANAIGNSGGSQPHDNMLPYVAINYIISLFGVFPSQT